MGESNGTGEVQLHNVLESLQGKGQKERSDALKNLKEIFDRSHRISNIGVLADKAYHKIYEVLFKLALSEKQSLLASKKNTTAASLNRLTACADVIRVVVKAGASKLKPKTVDAVVDHIIQTIPKPDGGYCEPLTPAYLKALSALFEHQSNAEHLKSARWGEIVDFCLEGVDCYLDEHDGEPSGLSHSFSGLASGSLARSSSGNLYVSRKNGSLTRQNVEDLLQTLLLLVSVSNAPLASKYEALADTTLRFLQLQGSPVSQVHQTTFSILNAVLCFTRTDHVAFSLSVAQNVLPTISRFWQGKSVAKDEMLNSVRIEMLVLLIQIHPHLELGMMKKEASLLYSKLEDLADVMRADYTRRSDRDQLQLDDIQMVDMGTNDNHTHPFHLRNFHLRPHVFRTERNWAQLQVIGILERLLRIATVRHPPVATSKNLNIDKYPMKRQRVAGISDRLLDPLNSDDEKTRIGGLHILPFVLQDCQLSLPEMSALLSQLQVCASDKRGSVATWALLGISSSAHQIKAKEVNVNDWIQLWHIGARSLTFAVTCRAASLQLHSILAEKLVSFHDVGEDINAMVNAADTNGPAILCDSAIFLMTHLLHARVTEAPGSSLSTSQCVVRWLFAKWTPDDRSFAMHYALHVQPHSIMTLLRTCFGLPREKRQAMAVLPCGPVAQAWQSYLNTQVVVRYLLLLDDLETIAQGPICASCPKPTGSDKINLAIGGTHFQSITKLVLELLAPKCRGFLESWKNYTVDRSAPISTDIYRSAVFTCLTILLAMTFMVNSKLHSLKDLESDVMELSRGLVSFILESDARDSKGAQSNFEVLLQAIHSRLPSASGADFVRQMKDAPHLLEFLGGVGELCRQRRLAIGLNSNGGLDDDVMDIDDDFSTQASHGIGDREVTAIPRWDLALKMDALTFQLTVSGTLILIADLCAKPDLIGSLPPAFIKYLMSLSVEEFLSSRQGILDVLHLDLAADGADLSEIFNRVGEILASVEFERCEVVLAFCIDILLSLTSYWTKEDDTSNVAETASEIYQWFISIALKNDIASPEVQRRIAQLLLHLMQVAPDYGLEHGLPSVRSSLFTLLQNSGVSVRFFIGDYIPDVFGHFVLADHDQVFLDILENLPSNPEWEEGISLRLFVLAKLASRWSNLLRRCIYHIFETPGRVASSVDHATKCIRDVASALKVNGPKGIFSLFAPQVLFTWCENDLIEDIPFRIFGFPSLRDLVSFACEELTGILIMHGLDSQVDEISKLLGIDQSTLLQRSFTKVMAYGISQDLSVAKNKVVSNSSTTNETRVRKLLGSELFFEKVNLHFADTIALILGTVDQESGVEKYLSRVDEFQYAVTILTEIKRLGCSDMVLPASQQPSFSAKYLPMQILHLCSKTQYALETLYSPALVTFIARKLLNTVHPALGSLHKCSVLRKLRILVSLAGKTAIEGYPLEMLLQAIREFLVDSECTDDAIGILKYLLNGGLPYLTTQPSFVVGFALSIFGSLRVFLKSTQSSTTQESQFRTTMSVADSFRKWFGVFLAAYESPALKGDSKKQFWNLISSAIETQSIGNADAGSTESHLLDQLLKDEQSGGLKLTSSSRALALEMLCSEFRLPTSFRTDFLGEDALSIESAAVVWKSCRGGSISAEYISWAARVLGRAFAASGHIRNELLQESSLKTLKQSTDSTSGSGDSILSILNILQDLTRVQDPKTAGLGESALRLIVSIPDESLDDMWNEGLSAPIYQASVWHPYHVPPSQTFEVDLEHVDYVELLSDGAILQQHWLRNLCIGLAQSVPNEYLLRALLPILRDVTGFAEQVFPFVLHLTLSASAHDPHFSKKKISKAFVDWFDRNEVANPDNMRMLLNSLLYLRTQPMAGEKSSADRANWLDIDYLKASSAASRCGMHKTALLFAEEYCNEPAKASRRTSTVVDGPQITDELLLSIFKNIDDPDMYYGVQQKATLGSILARFEYEKDGPKSLAFRGAQYDSNIRRGASDSTKDLQSVVKALDFLSLSGVSHSLLQSQQTVGMTTTSLDSMFRTARKLEQWDIPVPPAHNSNDLTIYKAFQAIHTSTDRSTIYRALNEGFESTMRTIVGKDLSAHALHGSLQTLATLVEMDEILSSEGSTEFETILERFQSRAAWMKTGRFDDISQIISCRGTVLSTLSKHPKLQSAMQIPPLDVRLIEVQSALLASRVNRNHNALQESLSLATSMIDLIGPCSELGLNVDVLIHVEAANTLWDQGEMASSIGMLQALDNAAVLKSQTIQLGRADLLSQIGYQVSVARLEKADRIVERYLKPALKELKGKTSGNEAGKVFHQFAVFCDQQLQDPDSLEDLERLKRLRKNKSEEVAQYEKLLKSTTNSSEKSKYKSHQRKAETWLKLDEEELRRYNASREELLRQCLENYLLALIASDDHDGNALRFSALWLEHSEVQLANESVSKYLSQVPSRKLAPLMNQLTSRLQDTAVKFQRLLYALVLRICTEHPYHGMYQIYAAIKSKPNSKDETAGLRLKAANKLAKELHSGAASTSIWVSIHNTNSGYCLLAAERDDRYASGKKVAFGSSAAAQKLASTLPKCKTPPPTMHIPLAVDMNYSHVPTLYKFDSQIAIASGVSAPKIITAIASDGSRYKQLVKGGNDDLRQDAIMEQVFEQVSALLKTNRSTRQRNLSIRTYKVLPLTSIAGVIEFVPSTIPLHDYLMPAHAKYHPKDWKGQQCRKEIGDVQTQSVDTRVKKFRAVCEKFKPVMRYFFTERFHDPDEWFARRLAYTRSTAAISILGHVLGLGDRHGHNILLDTKSGEVVHIDLGVAFEMGRVLPVPELVPFRLTRDIIDGMGITKTEGVFRRCCEFTLEALRKEVYSIMTILDVLRYDPLYSWSISPVRLAKLQEEQSVAPEAVDVGRANDRGRDGVNEPGEADRALTVVNKKLSKTLSVTATVNDLINQASDEKNLAVLYSGWAAYV